MCIILHISINSPKTKNMTQKFAKDAYYNLLMLGIKSPVDILKNFPTHTPTHTCTHTRTCKNPRTPAQNCAHQSTSAHTRTYLCTTTHIRAYLRMPTHDICDICNKLKAKFKKKKTNQQIKNANIPW